MSWAAALLLGAALLLWGAAPAAAEPLRRLGQNPRGLALGGTGMSYSNDEMALYYNPAGLGSVDNWWLELTPLAIEASDPAVDLATKGEIGAFDSPAELIRNNVGKEIQIRALFYPTGVFNVYPGVTIGAGYFYEAQSEMRIRNQATPEIEAFFRLDQGQAWGISAQSGQGKFLWGASTRRITRRTGSGTLSSAEIALASARGELDLEESLDLSEGSGVAYDLGLIWRIEALSRLRGQFALTIQDFGGTELGEAGEIPQEISMGWSIRPEGPPFLPIMMALEFRDLTQALSDDSSIGKRTHFGLEVGLFPMDVSTNLITMRGGYNAGNLSYGVELAFWHTFSLQYVVYYQEFGAAAGQDSRRRQILQLNLIGF